MALRNRHNCSKAGVRHRREFVSCWQAFSGVVLCVFPLFHCEEVVVDVAVWGDGLAEAGEFGAVCGELFEQLG